MRPDQRQALATLQKLQKAVLEHYRGMVVARQPSRVTIWPVLSGCNFTWYSHGTTFILRMHHNGVGGPVVTNGVTNIAGLTDVFSLSWFEKTMGCDDKDLSITVPATTIAAWHSGVCDHAALSADIQPQLESAFLRHEIVQGLRSMKIFLSHKGVDKGKVREFFDLLKLLGFDPWLDEDAMSAGALLHREILAGMKSSCAVVFFVTPKFVDDKYLATEIDYAITEKTERADFVIVTLAFTDSEGNKPRVPELLHRFLWVEAKSDLFALQTIIKALPVCVGDVRPKLRG